MFDFKYHIVSLVAVFLALGIGVVMGSMSAERGVVSEQERALIATMEKDFEKLRSSNAELNSQLAVATRFQEGAIALLTEGKLAQQNVAVIVTGDVDATTLKNLKASLEQAGATQQSVTTFSGKLGLDNKNTAEKVAAIVGGNPQGQAATRNKALEETARWIADGLNPKGINDLVDAGFMQTSGTFDKTVQAVIVIGGSQNGGKNLPPEQLDEQIIKTLKQLPVTLAGVETSNVKTSYMKTYQGLNINTVDNIDKASGQIAVVYILAGQAGDFGEKATADTLMPEPTKNQ
ncbi:MAG: copper transporter [Actinomycetota bacterium]